MRIDRQDGIPTGPAPHGPFRHALNGPTMGTRYSAVFYDAGATDLAALQAALQSSVDAVDGQMSTWKPQSALMRFNAAPTAEWIEVPPELLTVVETALAIGRLSDGAFDIAVFDLVRAWGFADHGRAPDATEVEALARTPRRPAHELVEVDRPGLRLRKRGPVSLDLSGIAKGYGVDRLAETLLGFGIADFVVSIDGEIRAMGSKPLGAPWRVAVEKPDPDSRDIGGVVELRDAALATSGSYRHRVAMGGRSFSHTMDPHTGRPLDNAVQAVTVEAPTCMEADAWATAMMVLGPARGFPLLHRLGYRALFAEGMPG